MLAYLAGSIEFANDGGRSWRLDLRKFVEKVLHDEVYDPAEDQKKNLTEEEAENFRSWKTMDVRRYRATVRKIIDFDLDLIEKRSDYVIGYLQSQQSQGGGTASELTVAYRMGIPVYLVIEPPVSEVSGWALSCAEEVFTSFESLKEFLLSKKSQRPKSRRMSASGSR